MYKLTTEEFLEILHGAETFTDVETAMRIGGKVYEYLRDEYNRLHDGGVHTLTEIDDAVHEMIAHNTNVVRLV